MYYPSNTVQVVITNRIVKIVRWIGEMHCKEGDISTIIAIVQKNFKKEKITNSAAI